MSKVTRANIEELTAFLPVFAPPCEEPSGHMILPGSNSDVHQLPYMRYDESVSEFFQLVAGPPWDEFEYDPAVCAGRLRIAGAIEQANLPELAELLKYCERGERFCDGHWMAMIREGYVYRILCRLDAIGKDM